jgi:hypothetical protein
MENSRKRAALAQATVTARALYPAEMRVIEILQSRFLENAGDAAALEELAKLLPVCNVRGLSAGLRGLARKAGDQEAMWADISAP